MPRKSFEAQSHVNQIADLFIVLLQLRELRRLLQCIFQLDVELIGNELRQPVHVAVRHIERAAHILDRRLRRHRPESDDLRHALVAVFLPDVLDHLAPAPIAKIDVNVWQRHALRIQKSLKKQIVLQRIDVGDPQCVADQAPCRRAAPWPHRNSLRARVMNEIPHDQEVARKIHLLDHLDFARKAALVGIKRLAQQSLRCQHFQLWQSPGESLADDFFEIGICGVAFRHLKFREGIIDALDLHAAAFGDRHSPRHRVRQFAEDASHFLCRLEIKLVGRELHAIDVAHGLARLNAHQNFLRASIGLLQIVRIVRGDERYPGLARKLHQIAVHPRLDFHSLVLHFQEKLSFPENFLQAIGGRARLIKLLFGNCLGNFAAQARRKRDQSLAVPRQQIVVDARLVIKSFEVSG